MRISSTMLMVLVCCGAVAACGSEGADTGSVQSASHVQMPLILNSPDGATLRLTNARFTFAGTSNQTVTAPNDQQLFDVDVPAGAYTVKLEDGWQITKTVNGQVTPLKAKLVSANPVALNVGSQVIQPLVFKFSLDTGAVQFGSGRVEIAAQIDFGAKLDIISAPPEGAWSLDLSADGKTVLMGSPTSNITSLALWKDGGTVVPVADVSGTTGATIRTTQMSADGNTVIVNVDVNGTSSPYRWQAVTGLTPLPITLPAGQTGGLMLDTLSADGSVIFGHSDTGCFRWTGGTSTAIANCSRLIDCNADGSVAVGSQIVITVEHALRWSSLAGATPLNLPADVAHSEATKLGSDGSVFGTAYRSSGDSYVYRWSPTTGSAQIYGAASLFGSVGGASSDGSLAAIFVSGARNFAGLVYVWDAQNGLRSLSGLLKQAGVDAVGVGFLAAEGVSADSRVVVGTADIENKHVAFRAVLPAGI